MTMHGVEKSIIIRGVLYVLAAVTIVVCAAFGWITEADSNAWFDRLPELIGVGVAVLAGSNLHRGSNSRVTEEDVLEPVGPMAAGEVVDELLDVVQYRVREAVENVMRTEVDKYVPNVPPAEPYQMGGVNRDPADRDVDGSVFPG